MNMKTLATHKDQQTKTRFCCTFHTDKNLNIEKVVADDKETIAHIFPAQNVLTDLDQSRRHIFTSKMFDNGFPEPLVDLWFSR